MPLSFNSMAYFRGVVQLVEHRSPKPEVGSSSLSAPASKVINCQN